jgi:NDP-sugar pyrophosphorylase family protein
MNILKKNNLYAALILGSGYGSRLYPLTKIIPKILFSFRGKPLLKHHLDNLKNKYIKKIYVNILKKFFDKHLLNLNVNKKKLNFLLEKSPVGNGKTLLNLLIKEKKYNILLIYSDTYFLDYQKKIIKKLMKISNNKYITISISRLENRKDIASKGNIILKNKKIINFTEKPKKTLKTNYFFSGLVIIPCTVRKKVISMLKINAKKYTRVDFAKTILMSKEFIIKYYITKKKPLDFGNWKDLTKNYKYDTRLLK